MISKLFLVPVVVFLSWSFLLDIVQTSSDSGSNGRSIWNIRRNIYGNVNTSSTSSGNKRQNNDATSSKPKKKKIHLKYRNLSQPVELNIINEEIENSLKNCEREMVKDGKPYRYVWQNHEALTKDKMQFLCLKGWMYFNSAIKESLVDIMEPDCDAALILGPSDRSSCTRTMIGHFRYAPELIGEIFLADIIRCNCAYTKLIGNSTLKRVAIGFTKQYFYMHKVANKMYCILTIIGDIESRDVNIIKCLPI